MALVPVTIFGSSFTGAETTFLQGFADLTHTQGDVWYANSSGQVARLAAGTSGYVLTSGGAGANPSWTSVSGGSPSIGGTLTSGTAGSILFSGSAVFAQDNSQLFWDDTNHWLGIGTNVPTNAITLGSTATGFIDYNTVDQVTNTEFYQALWSANTYIMQARNTGTGTARSIQIRALSTAGLQINPTSPYITTMAASYGAAATAITDFGTGVTLSGASLVRTVFALQPTISQSSTAGYTVLLINPTESSTGSGTNSLMSLQVAASEKFAVRNTGHVVIEGVTSTGATGTGNFVFASSPTLTTPTLGVASATTINKVTLTAPATGSTLTIADGKTLTVSNSITLAGPDSTTMTFPTTSATIARTDAANTFTGHQTIEGVTSTGATGTGNFVFSASPTLVTPTLGVASATTINKVTLTAPASGSTLTIVDGKTLTVNQTMTLTSGGTSSVMTFPNATDTVACLGTTQTFTAVQTNSTINITTPQTVTVSSNAGTCDVTHEIQNFTNSSASAMTITLTTTSAVDGQKKIVRIFDASAVAKGITWVNTENSLVTAPANSNGSTSIPTTVGFIYNSGTSKWTCVAAC